MKKKIIISLFIGLILLGCNEMNLNPLSEGSSGNWYSDKDEITMSLNHLFDINYWEDFYFSSASNWLDYWQESWSDNFVIRYTLSSFMGGTINGQTDMIVKWWQNSYACIENANLIIENINRAKDKITEEKMNKFIAVAKFVRAAQYSKLIFFYGDVPYYTNTLEITGAFSLSRTNKEDILQGIYDDFDFAASYLPESYGDNEIKYATKGAALAMKARIALYMGDWDVTRDAAKACMDLDVNELYPDFSGLFGQKNSVETVFAIPRSVELGSFINIEQIVPRNCGGYSTVVPSWDLFCSYLCTDGLPIDESPLFNPHEPFKNRDPRCAATIVEFGTYYLGVMYQPHPDTLNVWNINTNSYQNNRDSRGYMSMASYTGLIWKKWVKEGWYTSNKGDMDNIVMRYADVLLMYAEAKIELGEIDQSVLDAINKVRSRAYGVAYNQPSSYPAVTSNDQSVLRKTVRIERRMEFAFEGTRLADILRWKLAEKVMNKNIYGMLDPADLRVKIVNPGLWFFPETPPIDEDGIADFSPMYNKGLIKLLAQRSFDISKNYLLPIPTKEILINKNLTQNPGY
jgi:starch-binding outer membrane protein, SusD/RagB family